MKTSIYSICPILSNSDVHLKPTSKCRLKSCSKIKKTNMKSSSLKGYRKNSSKKSRKHYLTIYSANTATANTFL